MPFFIGGYMKFKLKVITRRLGDCAIKTYQIIRVLDGAVVMQDSRKKKVVPILNLLNHYKGM